MTSSVADDMLRLHRALADPARARILERLRESGPLGVPEVARDVGLHPNTVRSHLGVLVGAGLVQSTTAPGGRPGRPRALYRALDEPDQAPAEGPGYELLSRILVSHLAGTAPEPAAAARDAGVKWGRYMTPKPAPFTDVTAEAALAQVIELFRGLGFLPEARVGGTEAQVLLRRCPFRAAALANPTIVCAMHLGLLQGTLAELGAPLTVTRLDPWVEPSLCVAHLDSSAPGAEPSTEAARR